VTARADRLRLAFVLGSRGEWGYIKPVIDEATRRGHESHIIAVNMAVLPRYGDLANHVSSLGYTVSSRIFSAYEGDLHATMAKSVFSAGGGVVDALVQLSPDWLVLAGDRAEQLGAAIAGSFLYTPTAHIQAGEVSGNIDDTSRHAIARFAHLHFASNEDAVIRLERSGEQRWRVQLTGAPQLDEVRRSEKRGFDVVKRLSLPVSDFCLAVFHPVTESRGELQAQTQELLAALDEVGRYCVWILPNNDAGAHQIRELIESRSRVANSVFVNLERRDFLGLMQASAYMVGNSSAGILEAPSLGVPAVNVGRRQLGRIRGVNVIDVESKSQSIVEGISLALDPEFRRKCFEGKNPYGDGHASTRIVDSLESTPVDQRLLIKRLTI
jgi:GDP/UDP-N,N'-diacetylbacillosamine 2-epimerase (hydrolysing)